MSETACTKINTLSRVLDYKSYNAIRKPCVLNNIWLLQEPSEKQENYLSGFLDLQKWTFILNRFFFLRQPSFLQFLFFSFFISFLIQLLMQVPRERIKIAFRLWIPILVLRIAVAETWPQALNLNTLGLASIVSDLFFFCNLLIRRNNRVI